VAVSIIKTKIKLDPPFVDLAPDAKKIEAEIDDKFSIEKFREAVYYLKESGIPIRDIYDELGVPESTFFAWLSGQRNPTDPYYLLVVRAWAKHVKEYRELCEQRIASHEPFFSSP